MVYILTSQMIIIFVDSLVFIVRIIYNGCLRLKTGWFCYRSLDRNLIIETKSIYITYFHCLWMCI